MLKTSILDRFTAPLCDSVTERDDSHEVLLALERANLFIVPLDESRQWYRYHRLFGEMLRQQLRTVETLDLVSFLHKRASQWYEANGFTADAVRHALAGSDWERAAALILDAGESMLKRGEVITLLGWFRALPDKVVFAHPQLCMEYCWPLILTEQIDTAEPYLAQAEQVALEQVVELSEQALEALYNMASQASWQSTITQVRALQALAAPTPEQALAFIIKALTRAQPENYVRTFVDTGEPMQALLREAAVRGVAPEYVRKLLAAFSRPPHLRPPPPTQPLVEPLSDRELEILHLLADGQTNQEIAQTLCVSVNTVKTHLKNVYGKLGVSSRREATAQAKKFGLVA